MRERNFFMMCCAALLAALAFLSIPMHSEKDEEGPPQRVLFANSGGTVVFQHADHAEAYKISCEKCHHESPAPRPNAKKCRDCHGKTFDSAFLKEHVAFYYDNDSCATCHHLEHGPVKWNHQEHAQTHSKNNCATCHHKDKLIEPEPQNCAKCHTHGINTDKEQIWLPLLGNAAHNRCISCHEESFNSAKGCTKCHDVKRTRDSLPQKGLFQPHNDYRSCVICHARPAEKLILSPMDAFHKKCMSCHEKLNRGPFGKENCAKCHTK